MVGITHPFRSHKACCNGPTIQTTIPQSNQVTRWGHSDWEFPLGILKSGTDVKSGIFGRNINNHTGVNPQDTPKTTSPDINRAKSFSLRGLSDFTNWNASIPDAGQSEDPFCSNIFKNDRREKCFEVENFERKFLNTIHIELTYRDSN